MAERQTFAFEVGQPVQGRPSAQGGASIGQLVGGEVMGGDRSGVGGDNSAMFGGFLDSLLAPFAERKAKEEFARGVTDQMYAEAGQEVRAGNSVLTKIFGPTAYEEGAVFYEAQQRVSNAQLAWAEREDELKRMSPEEVSRQWADHLEATKVGDYFLDQMISDDMLKAAPAMLQSVAKANFQYRQEEASKSQMGAWSAFGSSYQAYAKSFAATANPGEGDVAGYRAATQDFLSRFVPVIGQDEDVFKKNLTNALRTFAQRKEGHAVQALLRSGALDVLDVDQRVKVEDMIRPYANQAVAAAAMEMQTEIAQLDYDIEWGVATPTDAMNRKLAINERIKRATGFDADYYDAADVSGTGRAVIREIRRQAERAEDRAEAIADREDRQAHEIEMEKAKAGLDASIAEAAWSAANPAEYLAKNGGKDEVFAQRIYSGYVSNDFAGMDRAFRSGVQSPKTIKDSLQNTISGQVSNFNPTEFEAISQKFTGMLQTNPALAKEYFGNAFAPMRQFQTQVRNGTSPTVAFAIAFGDTSRYQPSGAETATASKEIKAAVSDMQAGWFSRTFFGGVTLNQSAQAALSNLVAAEVAMDKKGGGGDLSDKTLIASNIQRVINSGKFESVGPLGWRNDEAGAQPIWKGLGLPKDLADAVIYDQIDVSLRNRGFAAGAEAGEYHIVRTKVRGKPALVVTPVDEDGNFQIGMSATVTHGQLEAAAAKAKQGMAGGSAAALSRKAGAEAAVKAGLDPRRRIKGERVIDRVLRINMENRLRAQAGVKPTRTYGYQ